MRTIIWFIYFWVILICYCPFQWYAAYLERKGKIKQKEALVSKCVTAWAWSLLKLAGVRLTVSGKENIPNETCIYVSNHQGNFDIPILLTCLDKPHALLAKKEIRKIPMVRTWMKLFGCIFIDRNNMRNAMTAINEAIEAVKQGKSMIIFPEGTRSKGGEMGQFKGGAFRVCEKSRVQ